MGDIRFLHAYEQVRDASDRARRLHSLSDEEVIGALAAASRELDPLMANVLATEAMNRARRAKAIAVSIGEGVLVLDVNGRIGYANPMAERLLERPRDELVGRSLNDALRPVGQDGRPIDLDADVAQVLDQTLASREREDLCLTRADGDRIPVSCTTSLVLRDEDEISGLVVSFRDIAERKQAEAQLREAWTLYKLLAHNSSDLVTLSASDGRTTYVSPASTRILGRDPPELLGLGWRELVHPDDRGALERDLRRVLRCQETYVLTYRMLHADGAYRWMETTARRIEHDEPDGVGGAQVLAVTRDVTARKHANDAMRAQEERFRMLTENTTDLVAVLDVDGRIGYASAACERLLALPPEALLRRSVWDFVHPDDREHVRALHAVLLRPGWDGSLTATLRLAPPHAPEGQEAGTTARERTHAAWAEMTLRRLPHTEHHADDRVLCVVRDVTARILTEQALQRSERRYRRLAENAADLLCTLDARGTLTYVSPLAGDTLGYPPHELTGRSVWELLHPADRGPARSLARRIARTQAPGRTTVHVRRADGEHVPLDARIRPIRRPHDNDASEFVVACCLPTTAVSTEGPPTRPA